VQNDFLSSVSHELRTPLTSIRMFIETLRDRRLTDPEAQRQCLDLLQREVVRLDGLIDRLIDLSRIESGRHAFVREPVVLADVARDALDALDAATLGKAVRVEAQLDDGARVLGDRGALSLAVSNLLMNAYKYTAPGERVIRLGVAAAGPREVEVVVEDNGIGITREEQGRIFDHFERGQAAVDGRIGGSGLGLAIVRAIVEAHGGKVDVRSQRGQGSRFRIRLRRLAERGER
jgi:signal transduction histidine kinase